MSLISEALKKAQAQRQGSAPVAATPPVPPTPSTVAQDPTRATIPPAPTVPETGATPPRKTEKPPRWGVVVAVVAGLAIIFGGGAALLVWSVLGLSDSDTPSPSATAVTEAAAPPPTAPQTAPPATATASTAAPSPIEESEPAISAEPAPENLKPVVFKVNAPAEAAPPPPAASTAPAANPVSRPTASRSASAEPVPTVVAFPQAAPATEAVFSTPQPVPVATRTPPPVVHSARPTPPPVPPPSPAPAAPEVQAAAIPDPAIESQLATLEVRGVMSGGQKVLLFDPAEQRSRAYAPGDRILETGGVRVVEITSEHLKFTDERGAHYTKQF